MNQLASIRWLAGYLEGEGSFTYNLLHPQTRPNSYSARISVVSTDYDIAKHAADILGGYICGPYKYGDNKKYYWQVGITGKRAIGWMMTLYSLMGSRRREKIMTILTNWRAHRNLKSGPKPKGSIE